MAKANDVFGQMGKKITPEMVADSMATCQKELDAIFAWADKDKDGFINRDVSRSLPILMPNTPIADARFHESKLANACCD